MKKETKETLANIWEKTKDAWNNCEPASIIRPSDLIDEHIQEAVLFEREKQETLAAKAMLDAGISEEKVIEMLQKHWDKRRSESENILETAKNALSIHVSPEEIT